MPTLLLMKFNGCCCSCCCPYCCPSPAAAPAAPATAAAAAPACCCPCCCNAVAATAAARYFWRCIRWFQWAADTVWGVVRCCWSCCCCCCRAAPAAAPAAPAAPPAAAALAAAPAAVESSNHVRCWLRGASQYTATDTLSLLLRTLAIPRAGPPPFCRIAHLALSQPLRPTLPTRPIWIYEADRV